MFQSDNTIRSDSEIQVEKERSYIPLMNFEVSFQIMINEGVATVSFFPANDVDFEVSRRKLKARLRKICEANPWLVGTLVKDKRRHKRLLCSIPNTITDEDIDAIFYSESSDTTLENISSSSPYLKVAKAMDKLGGMCKSGYELVNKPDRMCKVTLLPTNGGKEFAFVFSVAHVVADGCTYHNLLSMFRDDITVESLKVQRLNNFDDVISDNIGKVEKEMLESPYVFANLMRREFRPPLSKICASYVDPIKISKAKQQAKREHSDDPNFYTSTNDILTSAFGKAMECSLLIMVLNLRGRTQAIHRNFAGNYQTLVWYDKDSYDKPSKIRKSLSRGPPFQRTSGREALTRWEQTTTDIGLVSSWIFPSFDADIHLWKKDGSPSSLVTLHLPLYAKPPSFPVFVIFKPCKGKLAVFSFEGENDDYHKRLLESGNLLGEPVRLGMFGSI